MGCEEMSRAWRQRRMRRVREWWDVKVREEDPVYWQIRVACKTLAIPICCTRLYDRRAILVTLAINDYLAVLVTYQSDF